MTLALEVVLECALRFPWPPKEEGGLHGIEKTPKERQEKTVKNVKIHQKHSKSKIRDFRIPIVKIVAPPSYHFGAWPNKLWPGLDLSENIERIYVWWSCWFLRRTPFACWYPTSISTGSSWKSTCIWKGNGSWKESLAIKITSFSKEFVLASVRCLHDISDVVSWDSTKHEKPLCLFRGHLLDSFFGRL